MANPEAMQVYPQIDITKRDGYEIERIIPFSAPHEKRGYIKGLGLARCGSREVTLMAASGIKEGRGLMVSGDSLFITSIGVKGKGRLLLTDIEDGFTPVSHDEWRSHPETRGLSPDAFLSSITYDFSHSQNFDYWMEKTGGVLKNMPSDIDKFVPGHASFNIEGALKWLTRGYLVAKNNYRKQMIGEFLDRTNMGKEMANGIFGVTALWIPLEMGQIPEAKGVGISGDVGGVAICRSLADTILSISWPAQKVFSTDANQYVDQLFAFAKKLMSPENFTKFRSQLYEKINMVYAAFSHTGELHFPLTEEEQFSGELNTKKGLDIAGATDGAFFEDRSHNGVPEALYIRALNAMLADPRTFTNKLSAPKDDYLIYGISLN